MKILLIKLGMEYTPNPEVKHAAIGEVDSIRSMLVGAGHTVNILTKKYYEDDSLHCHNDPIFDLTNTNTNGYDLVFVVNGLIRGNFDDMTDIFNAKQYQIIENADCPVIFALCDVELPLRRLTLTRTDIKCVTQARNVGTLERYLSVNDDLYDFENITYFPFQKFPFLTACIGTHSEQSHENVFMPINDNPEFDLLYGGGFREGRRVGKMLKYYFDWSHYRVGMFGNITEDHFTNHPHNILPNFMPAVPYEKFAEKMNTSLATVYIADESYANLGCVSQRVYECARAGCVMFVDLESDPNMNIFGSSLYLRNSLYVTSPDDVVKKLSKLKNDNMCRKLLIGVIRTHLLEYASHVEFAYNYSLYFDNLLKKNM